MGEGLHIQVKEIIYVEVEVYLQSVRNFHSNKIKLKKFRTNIFQI